MAASVARPTLLLLAACVAHARSARIAPASLITTARLRGGDVGNELTDDEIIDRLDEVPEGVLYVHCQSGVRSAVASAMLARHGRDIRYVNDAFPHYRELADDVATGA